MRRRLIFLQCVPAMPENHFRLGTLLQHMYLLIAPHPVVMISSQPPLRHTLIIVLVDVVHVSGKYPSSRFREINLHDAETRCVTRRMMHIDARSDLQEISRKGLPVQVKAHVFGQVNPEI
jgi:hypothetical protein